MAKNSTKQQMPSAPPSYEDVMSRNDKPPSYNLDVTALPQTSTEEQKTSFVKILCCPCKAVIKCLQFCFCSVTPNASNSNRREHGQYRQQNYGSNNMNSSLTSGAMLWTASRGHSSHNNSHYDHGSSGDNDNYCHSGGGNTHCNTGGGGHSGGGGDSGGGCDSGGVCDSGGGCTD